tara:strand:+ start:213 stop:758 length:546 start_codon:yes stop_codon:yes gene_type:complete
MGNKAAIALFGMSGILILFATYTSLLPDVIESKAQIEISSPKLQLIHYLSSAKDWDEWLFTEEIKKTEDWKTMTAGESDGEGSVLKWFSEGIGDGALEIKKIDSAQIVFERISDNNSFRDRCYLFLENSKNGTLLKMVDSLDLSTNFFARYEAQDQSYIDDIDSSNLEVLKRLKLILENNQ